MRKFFVLIIFLIFFSSAAVSFAKDSVKEDIISTPSSSKTMDYALPYPGLLPDNPLYVLKAVRDRIVETLISDPIKKANFELLQSDKRLNEGFFLFKKGESKYSLGESTISKGENYFEKGIDEIEKAKKRGTDLSDAPQRFYLSSVKQREIIKSLIKKSRGNIRQRLQKDDERMEEFEKELKPVNP